MHPPATARIVISALQKNLSIWTSSITERWSKIGLSHCPAPHVPIRFEHCNHSIISFGVQRWTFNSSEALSSHRHSSFHDPNSHCLTKQTLHNGIEQSVSRITLPIQLHNFGLQAEQAGTTLHCHQLDWSANVQNSRATLRPPAAAAPTVNAALAPLSHQRQFCSAASPRSLISNSNCSSTSASPISDWVAEWQTSEMARWLAARGEKWLLEEGPLLPHDHPTFGRGLITARAVKEGEPLIRVSKGLAATPHHLPEESRSAIPKEVTNEGRMAVFLALERRRGGASEWAPFVQAMPPLENLNNTFLWSDRELALLHESSLADVTRQQQCVVAAEYNALRPLMEARPELFNGVPLSELEFRHGYALVCSRAWGADLLKVPLAMIPFVDFFNHSTESTLKVFHDDDLGLLCVNADRDYNVGEQVFISYGNQSNAALALSHGFTVAENPHDELVAVWMSLPTDDPLWPRKKAVLVHKFHLQGEDPDIGAWFTLKLSEFDEAGQAPGSLSRMQLFERTTGATSAELDQVEAIGRGAKRLRTWSSKSWRRLTRLGDMRAVLAVIFQLEGMYSTCQEQEARLAKLLQSGEFSETVEDSVDFGGEKVLRRRVQMAYDVLRGEARVLRSAVNFLETGSASG